MRDNGARELCNTPTLGPVRIRRGWVRTPRGDAGPFVCVLTIGILFALPAITGNGGIWGTARAMAVQVQEPPKKAANPPAPKPKPTPTPTPAPGDAPAGERVLPDSGRDIATSFRFRETHGLGEGQTLAENPPQYRVAQRETISTAIEGEPAEPNSLTQNVVYSERPAQVDFHQDITAVVRRYESMKITPNTAGNAGSLAGLTVWCQPRMTGTPLVMSLTSGRRLREEDYQKVAVHAFIPSLEALIPVLPTRVGDTWRISMAGTQNLVRRRIRPTDALRGQLIEIQPVPNSVKKTAVFAITGKITSPLGGQTALNARVYFEFTPTTANGDAQPGTAPAPAEGTPPTTPTAPAPGNENATPPPANANAEPEVVNARGMITKISLAQAESSVIPDPDSPDGKNRTKTLVLKRQLVLERRFSPVTGGSEGVIAVPNPAPEPTVENSWLILVDPNRRFHIAHPQDFQPQMNPGNGVIDLIRDRAPAPDIINLAFFPTQTADFERKRRERFDQWRKDGEQAIAGASGSLRDADWPGRKAYRFEAVVQLPAAPKDTSKPRIYFDGYVIQFTRNASLYSEAMTPQPNPAAFRKEAEQILKTFTLGQPPAPPAAPAAPAPASNN